jgi:hypothetical protein
MHLSKQILGDEGIIKETDPNQCEGQLHFVKVLQLQKNYKHLQYSI